MLEEVERIPAQAVYWGRLEPKAGDRLYCQEGTSPWKGHDPINGNRGIHEGR